MLTALHVYRKMTRQYAVIAGNVELVVADDASVWPSILMTNDARLADQELRHKRNRTLQRIRSSLSREVAVRYGWQEKPGDGLIEKTEALENQGLLSIPDRSLTCNLRLRSRNCGKHGFSENLMVAIEIRFRALSQVSANVGGI